MTFVEVLALLAALCAGVLVWTSLRAREAANDAMRDACRAEGYLFLDDTVALESMRPARDADGRTTLRRVYGFEYSDTGDNRRKGSVTLQGTRIVVVDIGRVPAGARDQDDGLASTRQPSTTR